MDTLMTSIIDFIRIRQPNIAIAALLTVIYLVYRNREALFKLKDDEALYRHTTRLSRSRSRSRSRSKARAYPMCDKNCRRGRRLTRRCPDCSLCNMNNED